MAHDSPTALPTIERFEVFAGSPDSSKELLDLMCASEISVGGTSTWTLGEVDEGLADPQVPRVPNNIYVRDPASGTLVGAARFENKEPYIRSHLLGWVHPDFRGNGIATAMLEWGLNRTAATEHLATKGARITVECDVDVRNAAAIDLLAHSGFELTRHYLEMEIDLDGDLDPISLGPDVTLHIFDRNTDFESMADALFDAFEDHFGFVERPREQRHESLNRWMDTEDWDDTLVWLAKIDDEAVGANIASARFGSRLDTGYVHSLGVVRSARGKGIAKALLRTSFNELTKRGKSAVVLHVDAESLTGATRLYESVGMRPTQTYASYELEIRQGTDLVVR